MIQKYIINAADIVCIAGFMTLSGVCLSIWLSHQSTSAACHVAWAWAADIDR